MQRSTTSGSSKDEFVTLANELFRKFHIAPIRDLSECEPSSFITLYEGILGDRLKGVIPNPITREDDIHNVQCVIESLSRDVLHCDLSHITGLAVVDRDPITVQYLLEILEGLVDYVMEQIGSETSSEVNDFRPLPEVSSHSVAEGPSTRHVGDQPKMQSDPFVSGRSLESISLPSTISPRPDMEDVSEGSNSTAELIRLGEESASYRTRTAVRSEKIGDLNSTYQKSWLSKMYDSYGISEGRLSQLTDTTLREGSRSEIEPMSGSFSTITWPKAPSTMSSPSPVSKPATSTSLSRPAHTKAHLAEKVPPYNSLVGSLMNDYSDLPRSSGYQKATPPATTTIATRSLTTKDYSSPSELPQRRSLRLTPHATTTIPTKSSTTKDYNSPTEQPQRRSLRLTPQATTTSSASKVSRRSRTSQQLSGSSSKQPRASQRRSPRFTPSARQGPTVSLMSAGQSLGLHDARYSAKLPQPDAERGQRHSPPVRGSPAPSSLRTHPADLPRFVGDRKDGPSSSSSGRLRSATTASTYPARLPPASSRYNKSPVPQELDVSSERKRYPAMLPPHTRTTTATSETRGRDSVTQSPGVVASRLRGSVRRSLNGTSEEIRGKRERSREDSSMGADMENSYDRSFMRRKVARRRRVAFEDEQQSSSYPEGSPDERPSQRFRFSRESDEENNGPGMSYSPYSHITGDSRRLGELDQSRTESSEEEEEEEESHSYHLRERKKTGPQKKAKGQGDKGPKQRSVLLPRSIPQRREPLKVQFEDAMNRDAKGLLGKVRRQLADEASQQSKMKNVLQYSYAGSLREVKRGVKQQVTRRKKATKQLDEDYKAIHSKPKPTQYKPARKYTTSVAATEGSRRSSRSTKRTPPSRRKRAASTSPTSSMLGGDRPLRIGDDDLLPTLMHEFPFLHVSPHTAQRMWAQQMKHMEHLTKAAISHKYKKPKTQSKIEEAERKQDILVNIMKKELAHNQRLRDIKERRNQERAMQTKAKEQRQVNARARRYYDEYRVRAQSRALKRRTKEEQIFKHLFEEGMAIQKARIRELRKYAKEKREDYTKQQKNEVESLENYYRDQFSLLGETIAKERHDLNVRDRAQANALQRIKSDMRRKMEKEIREYQEELYRDEDAEYFRQLEAARMKHELQIAKYKAQL